jgi:hypothetical protein
MSGRVHFVAADRADTVAEVLPADASKSRDVKAAAQTTVDYADGVLRIRTPAAKNQHFGPSGSLEVTVQLPAGSHVEAKTACSEFRGIGRLNGAGQISTAWGDIQITEAVRGTVVLSTQPGGILVGAAAGVSACLAAGISFGRISNTLKNSEGAAAQLDIHATTSYGDILARSL